MTLSWLIHADFWVFRGILTHEVGQTDLVWFLACDQGSLVGFFACKITSHCVQWLLFVAPWLTSRHTPTHTDSILTSLYEKLNQLT